MLMYVVLAYLKYGHAIFITVLITDYSMVTTAQMMKTLKH